MKLLKSREKLPGSDPTWIQFSMCQIGFKLRPESFVSVRFGFEPRFKNPAFAEAAFEKA
jgi:hypothetical protein